MSGISIDDDCNVDNTLVIILSTVESYTKLAADPAKRKFLLKNETCIQFLAYILEENQPSEVVMAALKVLNLLNDKPEHADILSNIYGVIEALECLAKNVTDVFVATATRDTLERLRLARRLHLSNRSRNGNNRSVTLRDSFQANRQNDSNVTCSFFKPGLGALKYIVLQIHGLVTKDDRNRCEEILVKVSGVVSFTFDMSKRRCILRTKSELSSELLVSAISQTKTMTARHVMKGENGQEVFANAVTVETDVSKENVTSYLPDYLSENDGSPAKNDEDGRALTILGNDIRLTTNSWLSSAANFVNKSFYW